MSRQLQACNLRLAKPLPSLRCAKFRMGSGACRAATIIDGKQIAADVRQEIAAEVADLKAKAGKVRFTCGPFRVQVQAWQSQLTCAARPLQG
jgi:hypothetical protein